MLLTKNPKFISKRLKNGRFENSVSSRFLFLIYCILAFYNMQNKLQELTDKLYNEGLYCSFSNSLIHSFNLSCSSFLYFCCQAYGFTFVFAECKTFLDAASITTHEDKAKKSGWDEYVGPEECF